MTIDRDRLVRIFDELGQRLATPATICIIEDVAWWIKERALDLDKIRAAVGSLPEPLQRKTAGENILLVELFGTERKTR